VGGERTAKLNELIRLSETLDGTLDNSWVNSA